MITSKRNILQLVALLHEHGIEDVVLCPGSRNAAITHTINECGLFRCHAVTDERSAGFYAIGLALATHHPTAVCVTSGSALLNLHPAVAEAFYQQVPLVVISADRPAAWIGQMDGQTMPQKDAFGKLARMSVHLPEIHTEEDEWYVNRLCNEALLECNHRGQGPVHINVPISEPFYEFTTPQLPSVRTIRRLVGLTPANGRQMASLLSESSKRMIIIGQKPADKAIPASILDELDSGFVSICENLSNLGPGHIALMDPNRLIEAIPEGKEEEYAPDLVITLGGHIVSKPLKQFLRRHQPKQHWYVSPDGEVADLFCSLTTIIEAQPAGFLEALGYLMIGQNKGKNPFPLLWKDLVEQPPQPANLEEEVFASLLHGINVLAEQSLDGSCGTPVLHLANSTTIRLAQHYPLNPTITVCCNRGINGIDGSVSSAVGFAAATPQRPNFLIIGDLSFFYDQNGLWNRELPQNLHILLLNSKGGQIFQTLPIPENQKSQSYICAEHNFTAEALCQQYGFRYFHVQKKAEWQKALPLFLESPRNILAEISL